MVYESVKHRLTMGLEQYADAVKDWNILPVTQEGQVIGGVMAKDNEIHIGFGIPPKGTIRYLTKTILEPMIAQYGVVKTKVDVKNLKGLR
jgi:hypothetical protein